MKIVFYTLFCFCIPITAQDLPQKIVIADDGLLITNNQPSKAQSFSLLPMIYGSLTAQQKLYLAFSWAKIQRKGNEFALEPHATATSVIEKLIEWMKKEGYGDLTSIKNEMIQVAVNPQPIKSVVNLFKEKKKQHKVQLFNISNQDAWQYEESIKKLHEKHNLDFHDLCTLSLVSYSKIIKEKKQPTFNQDYGFYHLDEHTYMSPEGINKSHVDYFKTFQNIVQEKFPGEQHLLYIYDCKNSLETFQHIFSNPQQHSSYKPNKQKLMKNDREAIDELSKAITHFLK